MKTYPVSSPNFRGSIEHGTTVRQDAPVPITYAQLWAGADRKIEYAGYFLQQMQRSLDRHDRRLAYLEAAGAIVDTQWQRSFYPNFDAFLAMVRSVPDVVQWCFGVDRKHSKSWFRDLSPDQQARRKFFSLAYKPHYNTFSQLDLSKARNISLHRAGYPPVEVHITGLFGVTYVGNPIEGVPITESRPANPADNPADPAVLWAATRPPIPVHPRPDDFRIAGRPLFAECHAYFEHARNLAEEARGIYRRVHGAKSVTPPQ